MTQDRDKKDKRTAIMEAALELIAEAGFHGAPTSKIAHKANAGVGSIYRYFKDKDELISEIFNLKEKEIREACQHDVDPQAPARVRFIRHCSNIVRYFAGKPKIFSFLEQYFNSPYGMKCKREQLLETPEDDDTEEDRHLMLTLLRNAREQQIIKDLPLSVLHALTFGPIIFFLRDVHSGLIEYDDDLAERMVEACWDAIKR